jgi:hypothetical protein
VTEAELERITAITLQHLDELFGTRTTRATTPIGRIAELTGARGRVG